jgi:hypothetical protein
MSQTTDLIDAQVAAYQARDLTGFVANYAANAVIRDLDGQVLMTGVEAISEMYGQLFRDSPELSVEIPSRMEVGSYVIDEEVIAGFHLPGFPTEMHAVVIYRVQDGKIQEVVLLS